MAEPGTSEPRTDDAQVPWRIFVTVGVLVAVITAIYWFTAYEDAGTVMLALAAAMALWFGGFLWLLTRHTAEASPTAATPYLPDASVWPFAVGLGAALLANGLVLGIWVMVPGLALTALGIAGLITQSRRRA